jgi:hypothetical protein
MYFAKTRNWYCKKWVKVFLDITYLWGVTRGDNYDDRDGKYILQTNNKLLAKFTWRYFMLFYPFSGGWTYIRDQDNKMIRDSDPEYA